MFVKQKLTNTQRRWATIEKEIINVNSNKD